MTRFCHRCQTTKRHTEFWRDGHGGREQVCAACRNKRVRQRHMVCRACRNPRDRSEFADKRRICAECMRRRLTSETKVCRTCGEEKPLDEFWGDRNRLDGKNSECAECANSREHGDPNYVPTHWCSDCYGLPWRRPVRGTCSCGERHEDERPPPIPTVLRSSAGEWDKLPRLDTPGPGGHDA